MRIRNGVNAEYSLKKLHTQKKYYISKLWMDADAKLKSKDIIEIQINKDVELYNSKQWVTDKL